MAGRTAALPLGGGHGADGDDPDEGNVHHPRRLPAAAVPLRGGPRETAALAANDHHGAPAAAEPEPVEAHVSTFPGIGHDHGRASTCTAPRSNGGGRTWRRWRLSGSGGDLVFLLGQRAQSRRASTGSGHRPYTPWGKKANEGEGHNKPFLYWLRLIWHNEPWVFLGLLASVRYALLPARARLARAAAGDLRAGQHGGLQPHPVQDAVVRPGVGVAVFPGGGTGRVGVPRLGGAPAAAVGRAGRCWRSAAAASSGALAKRAAQAASAKFRTRTRAWAACRLPAQSDARHGRGGLPGGGCRGARRLGPVTVSAPLEMDRVGGRGRRCWVTPRTWPRSELSSGPTDESESYVYVQTFHDINEMTGRSTIWPAKTRTTTICAA